MTEDIVEFGAPPALTRKRAPRRARPQWLWLNNRMLPVAGIGVVAGAASLILPWQKISLRPVQNAIQPGPNDDNYEAMLISLGTFGAAYLLTLIATATVVAVIFYGNHLVPGTARVIGGALSGANLVILATTGFAFRKATIVLNVGFVIFTPEDRERMTFSLDWGFYSALAAVVALGVAALRAQPIPTAADDAESGSADEGSASGDEEEDGEPDDGVIDLSVSVHPVGKQVAAG
ncbi:MAG TPA: hypothetical protein VFC19_44260 [Candidatus Limnocylindrales bacterium]|nr:hypothetical protein [Candidatus Limnocylindrales bacterium]